MLSPLKDAWANPWVRRPVVLLLVIVLMLGGCWVAIDQMGREAWKNVEAQVAVEGETLDFRQLLPPPVPDEENFCAIPALRNLAAAVDDPSPAGEEGRRNRERLATIDSFMVPEAFSSSSRLPKVFLHDPVNPEEIAEYLRKGGYWTMPPESGDSASDLAQSMAAWDVYFDELATGLQRPQARWTPEIAQNLKRPWLGDERSEKVDVFVLARALGLRARVAAHTGDMRRAFECLRLADRLATASYQEPMLSGLRVGNAIVSLQVSAVWELTQTHLGTVQEWTELETLFARFDAQAATLRCLRGELAVEIDLLFYMRDFRRPEWLRSSLPDLPLSDFILRMAPPGFYDGAAAEPLEWRLRNVILPLRDGELRGLLVSADRAAMKEGWHPPAWNLAAKLFQVLSENNSAATALIDVLYTQALANQAAIACALERTRLQTGKYPGTLAETMLSDGRPLPPDPITGASMRYRLEGERYVLWSIGMNEKDDDGTRSGYEVFPINSADWVWSYAP